MRDVNREAASGRFEIIEGGRHSKLAAGHGAGIGARPGIGYEADNEAQLGVRQGADHRTGQALEQSAGESAYERAIEERFRRVAGDLQHFASSLQAACLGDHPLAREILDDLAAKRGKIAWTMGIARRAEGPARRRLWVDIERALGDLEASLRLLSRVQFVDGHWRVPAAEAAPLCDSIR
jgi:hypothetical protein